MGNIWSLRRLHLSPYGVTAAAINEAIAANLETNPDAPFRDQHFTDEEARALVLTNDFIHALGGTPLSRVLSRNEADQVDPRQPLVRLDLNTLEIALGDFDAAGLDALYGEGTGRSAVLAEVARFFELKAESAMMQEMDEARARTLPRMRAAPHVGQDDAPAALSQDMTQLPTGKLLLPFLRLPEE